MTNVPHRADPFAATTPSLAAPSTPPKLLDHCAVAAPCSGACATSDGNPRVSLCQRCGLFLYDVENLSPGAAHTLTVRTEGQTSGRLFKRRDGKVMTRNCPVGLEELRARLRKSTG